MDTATLENNPFPLFNLPDEILVYIIDLFADDIRRLCRLRSVCKKLRKLTEPYIYADYTIKSPTAATRLVHLVDGRPDRLSYFKACLVSARYEDRESLSALPNLFAQCKNLRSLILETPDLNQTLPEDRTEWVDLQNEYEGLFRKAYCTDEPHLRPFQNLEHCTLHFVDSQTSLYRISLYGSLFLHPTLRSIRISCACTDEPERLFRGREKYIRSTSLESLHLEECDIDSRALAKLLTFPKALKTLIISEGTRYDDDFGVGTQNPRVSGNLHPPALSQALTDSVADSLTSLSLHLGRERSREQAIYLPKHHLNLTGLSNLQTLSVHISTWSLLHTNPCDHLHHSRLPISLSHLKIYGMEFIRIRLTSNNPNLQDYLPAIYPHDPCLYTGKSSHGLPKLSKITWQYSHSELEHSIRFLGMLAARPARDNGNRARALQDAHIALNENSMRHWGVGNLYTFREHNIRFVIEARELPSNFIPPYLTSEKQPKYRTIWDSAHVTEGEEADAASRDADWKQYAPQREQRAREEREEARRRAMPGAFDDNEEMPAAEAVEHEQEQEQEQEQVEIEEEDEDNEDDEGLTQNLHWITNQIETNGPGAQMALNLLTAIAAQVGVQGAGQGQGQGQGQGPVQIQAIDLDDGGDEWEDIPGHGHGDAEDESDGEWVPGGNG